tara:strand:+ start:1487 stop:1672 length:186 start_codon:yes stop_codon:yes gene_type:complete
MAKQLNKVSKKDCLDAIEYLFTHGFSLEMSRDKKYYTEILLKKVANDYNIKLEGIDDEVEL